MSAREEILGRVRAALADRAVDADDVLTALVQDGVHRHGGLPRLAIAQDQLPLTAPDGHQRIDDLEAGLERYADGGTVEDGRGIALDRPAHGGLERTVPIERPPKATTSSP